MHQFSIILILLCTASNATAAPDLADVLINLRDVINPLTTLVMMISFVGGLALIWRAIGLLKRFGQPLTQMQQPGELSGPLVYFTVGAILLYVPTASDVITTSILGSNSGFFANGKINFEAAGTASADLLSYSSTTVSDQWNDIANTIVMYIQFIGFVAFIRGWFIISKAGARGEQPGVISKGIIFIISGILAMNFVPMITIIKNTIWGT